MYLRKQCCQSLLQTSNIVVGLYIERVLIWEIHRPTEISNTRPLKLTFYSNRAHNYTITFYFCYLLLTSKLHCLFAINTPLLITMWKCRAFENIRKTNFIYCTKYNKNFSEMLKKLDNNRKAGMNLLVFSLL